MNSGTKDSLMGFAIPMGLYWGLQSRDSACLHLATFWVSPKWFPKFSIWLRLLPPKEKWTAPVLRALYSDVLGTLKRHSDMVLTGMYGTGERPSAQSKYPYMKPLHRTTDYNYNLELCSLWKKHWSSYKDHKKILHPPSLNVCASTAGPYRGPRGHLTECPCQCPLYERHRFFLILHKTSIRIMKHTAI